MPPGKKYMLGPKKLTNDVYILWKAVMIVKIKKSISQRARYPIKKVEYKKYRNYCVDFFQKEKKK